MASTNMDPAFLAFMQEQFRAFSAQQSAAAQPAQPPSATQATIPATQAAPLETPRAPLAPIAPVKEVYLSARALPQPQAQSLVAPSSYAPFLGASTLAPSATNLNTAHVNAARLTNAAAVLPRRQTLARRGGRPVGSMGRRAPVLCFRPPPSLSLQFGIPSVDVPAEPVDTQRHAY